MQELKIHQLKTLLIAQNRTKKGDPCGWRLHECAIFMTLL
jgi:hypothetical protein